MYTKILRKCKNTSLEKLFNTVILIYKLQFQNHYTMTHVHAVMHETYVKAAYQNIPHIRI